MKNQKTKKKIPYLDYMCLVGERVQWKNVRGDYFEGILTYMSEDYLATVKLDNGTETQIQC